MILREGGREGGESVNEIRRTNIVRLPMNEQNLYPNSESVCVCALQLIARLSSLVWWMHMLR